MANWWDGMDDDGATTTEKDWWSDLPKFDFKPLDVSESAGSEEPAPSLGSELASGAEYLDMLDSVEPKASKQDEPRIITADDEVRYGKPKDSLFQHKDALWKAYELEEDPQLKSNYLVQAQVKEREIEARQETLDVDTPAFKESGMSSVADWKASESVTPGDRMLDLFGVRLALSINDNIGGSAARLISSAVYNDQEAAEFFMNKLDENNEFNRNMNKQGLLNERVANSLQSTLPSVVTFAGLAATTGGLGALAYVGINKGDEIYRRDKANGVSEGKALIHGMAGAGTEMAITALFMKYGGGASTEELLEFGGRRGATELLRGFGEELGEETLIEATDRAVDRMLGFKGKLTWEEAKETGIELLLGTTIGFGAANGMASFGKFAEQPSRSNAKAAGIPSEFTDTRAKRQKLADIANDTMTEEKFRAGLGQMAEAGAFTQDQADYLFKFVEGRAKAAGEDMADYLADRVQGIETASWDDFRGVNGRSLDKVSRAEIEFLAEDGRAVIRAFEGADFSSVVHEIGHMFRRDLSGPEFDRAARWAGAVKVEGGWKFDRKSEEMFARAFETYMLEGVAPTPTLKKVFDKVAVWMKEAYQAVKRTNSGVELNPEMRTTFDNLFDTEATVEGMHNDQTATAGVFAESGELGPTSLKNAQVDEDAAALGYEPMMAPATLENKQAWFMAMEKMDNDPGWKARLIQELGVKPRAVNPMESAALLHDRVLQRHLLYEALYRRQQARRSGDEAGVLEANNDVETYGKSLRDLEETTHNAGTEAGRSLQIRKMFINADYSLDVMLTRKSAALDRELSETEQQAVEDAYNDIRDKENKAAEVTERNKRTNENAAVTEAIKDVSRKAKAEAEKEAKQAAKDQEADEKAKREGKKPRKRRPKKEDNKDDLLGMIKEKIDVGDATAITPLVKRLAKVLWKDHGIKTRKNMMLALHSLLNPMAAHWNKRLTKHAFTGYGDFTEPSKADVDVAIREMAAEVLQIAKIEAIVAKEKLEATGFKRPGPTDAERRLQAAVHDVKKKYGVNLESQLKSAEQARRTYYVNRIADLKKAMERGQRIAREQGREATDPELIKLMEEYRETKAEYDEQFGNKELTEQQRQALVLKAAERNLAKWQGILSEAKKGKYDFETQRRRRYTSPELEVIKKQTEEVKLAVEELRTLADPQWRDKAILAKREAYYDKTIADLEKEIASGKRTEKVTKDQPTSPELEAKMAEVEQLRAERDSIFGDKQLTDVERMERAIAAAKRTADQLDQRVAEAERGEYDFNQPGRREFASPMIDMHRARADRARERLDELHTALDPDWKARAALTALKHRIAGRELYWLTRLANKDFAPRVRKRPPHDQEAIEYEIQADFAKEAFNKGMEKDRLARMSWFKYGVAQVPKAYDLGRNLMTTGEFSFVLRQAKFASLSHPIVTSKSLAASWQAFKIGGDAAAKRIEKAIHHHPLYQKALAAAVHLPDVNASLRGQEEFMTGAWSESIPGIRNFNRSGRVFMNKLRFDLFVQMHDKLAGGHPTAEQLSHIGTHINETTGRGRLGKHGEAAAVWLGRAFFAPRFVVSRFQVLLGHSLWGGDGNLTDVAKDMTVNFRNPETTRGLIVQEYARMLVGLGIFYTTMSWMLGDEDEPVTIERDTTSTDFGKMVIGSTRLDPLAGFQQAGVLISRWVHGEYKNLAGDVVALRGENVPYRGDTMSDKGKDFIQSKLHPMPSSFLKVSDLGTRGIDGEPITFKSVLWDLVHPITWEDVYNVWHEDYGITQKAAISMAAFFGEGVNVYGTYEKKPKTKRGR